jgi:hypothetical protein
MEAWIVSDHDKSRRDLLKTTVYIAPAILTLQAFSSLAKAGSVKDPTGDGPEMDESKVAREQEKCEAKEARINSRREARGKNPIDLDC